MFRKRPFSKYTDRSEQSPDAFRVHDEWTHVVLRMGIRFEVGNVIANPFSRRFVPPDLLAIRIPRLSIRTTGGPVVKHAPVRGPRPRPVGIYPHAGGILRASSLDLRVRLSPHAGINPVAAHGRTVILQPRKPRQLLA